MVGFLWIFPAAFAYCELREYNRLLSDKSFNIKSTKELSGLKAKIKIKVFTDMLQSISFVHTALFIIIGLMLLYDDMKNSHIIAISIFCVIISNAFTFLYMPKCEKLMMDGFDKGYKKVYKEFVKSINKLYKQAGKNIFKQMLISLFIILTLIIPIGMAIIMISIFIYGKMCVLAMLFTNIAIIMFMSIFAAVIHHVSNFATMADEKRRNLSFEVIATVAVYLYFFGDKESK
jgi:hypothetical protein